MTRRTKHVGGVAPDGGWGWIVVLGSSIINLSTRSIEPSFGLLFGDLLRDLGVATTGAAIIMSTLDAMINFSGLFVGPLIKQWSYRKVGIAGGLLSSLALMSTSSAESMIHIIITYSIIGGFGFGLATASTFVALNSYFVEKRGQAVGLAMAGTALGFMAMPQLVSVLLNYYGFKRAMLVLGAVALNSITGASLLQPVAWHLKPALPVVKEPDKEEEAVIEKNETGAKEALLEPPAPDRLIVRVWSGASVRRMGGVPSSASLAPNRKTSVISYVSHLDLMGSTMHFQVNEESESEDEESGIKINFKSNLEDGKHQSKKRSAKKKKKSCWSRFALMMDFDLLKDPVYLNILFGISMTYVGELNFKMVVPFFMAELGFTKTETATALSVMAVADIAARVIVPPILDRLPYSRRASLMFASLFVAASRSLLAEQTTWGLLMACLVVHGFFRGVTLINLNLVISEYATLEKYPAALGLSMVAKGCFIVVLGPLVGFIRDVTNSYPICIHTQSMMIMSCVIAWTIEYIIRCRSKKIIPQEDT